MVHLSNATEASVIATEATRFEERVNVRHNAWAGHHAILNFRAIRTQNAYTHKDIHGLKNAPTIRKYYGILLARDIAANMTANARVQPASNKNPSCTRNPARKTLNQIATYTHSYLHALLRVQVAPPRRLVVRAQELDVRVVIHIM